MAASGKGQRALHKHSFSLFMLEEGMRASPESLCKIFQIGVCCKSLQTHLLLCRDVACNTKPRFSGHKGLSKIINFCGGLMYYV